MKLSDVWMIVFALGIFKWYGGFELTPCTAYFLGAGHQGYVDYIAPYKQQFSTDRATQTVITAGNFWHTLHAPDAVLPLSNCVVFSSTNWRCKEFSAVDGVVTQNAVFYSYPFDPSAILQQSFTSVSWWRYYLEEFCLATQIKGQKTS